MTSTGRYPREPVPPHPALGDAVNCNLIRSEIEGGVHLRDLAPGAVLIVETSNRTYELVILDGENALISGHPELCPEPAPVRIYGSTWGGSMIKAKFLGRGMHLEFEHATHRRVVTSAIVEIRAA